MVLIKSEPDKEFEYISVTRINREETQKTDLAIAREFPLTIILNDLELVTLLCTPENLDYLAVGFLFAEGLIDNKEDVKRIITDDLRGVIRITTYDGGEPPHELLFKRLISSACGRGAAFYTTADAQHPAKIESNSEITPTEIWPLVRKFNEQCEIHRLTNGVHSAALCDRKHILVFNNDLGRHNAIDKVFGECILKGIETEDRFIITSGRTPSEMVLKVAKGKIPILISVSVPTDLSIRLARDLGITMVGAVRNGIMNVYTNDWRILDRAK
jgi:FdhD protein